MYKRMSKLERMNARVTKLLTEAVREVLDLVNETVTEYKERTFRTQRENESLRRRLLELQDRIHIEWTPALTPDECDQKLESIDDVQEVTGIQQHSSDTASTEPTLTSRRQTDGSVKQEDEAVRSWSETSSRVDSMLVSMSVENCEASEEVMMNHENLERSQESQRNMETSKDVFESSFLETHGADVKSESGPTSEEASPEDQHPGAEDWTLNPPGHSPAQTPGSLVRAEPPSSQSVPRRRGAVQTSGAVFDGRHYGMQCVSRENFHVCFVCGKTFNRVGNLRIHQRCHTGEKPYSCVQCGRSFSQAGDLKKHKRVHTGEKPYQCNQCGKSFSRGENLKRHERIHAAETSQLQQSWVHLQQ